MRLIYSPPIAVLVPGKAYRRDATDARHAFMFHQIEGLHVAEGISFAHLKGFAGDLCRHLFGREQQVRFRPSYFQFTEPSAEVVEPLARARGLHISGNLPRDRVEVETDPVKVRQMIVNLPSNAVKLTDRGRIILSGEQRGDKLVARQCCVVTVLQPFPGIDDLLRKG